MSGLPLVVDNAQCDLDVVDRERESFDSGSPKALGSSCAFGIMSESDFNFARGSMIDVDARLHYADWMDFRLGQQTALSWAGVDAFVVPIAAHPFLRWCALCGVAPSEQSLDAFAAIVNAPEIVVAARLDGMEFSSDGDAARNSRRQRRSLRIEPLQKRPSTRRRGASSRRGFRGLANLCGRGRRRTHA